MYSVVLYKPWSLSENEDSVNLVIVLVARIIFNWYVFLNFFIIQGFIGQSSFAIDIHKLYK